MKSIRIGNDIAITWKITRGDDPEDFSGKDLLLIMYDKNGLSTVISDFTTSGNEISFVFYGKDQEQTGVYHLTLYENKGIEGMSAVDSTPAFKLVDNSMDVGGKTHNIDVTSVDLTGDISAPANGLSAYELAKTQGYEGTLDEWLASLKGAKGDKGLSGNINYPKFEINDDMDLIMDTDAASNEDHFNLENGNLILTI